jgi:hypothetical protein
MTDNSKAFKTFRARVFYMFDNHSLEVRIYDKNFDLISTLTMKIG